MRLLFLSLLLVQQVISFAGEIKYPISEVPLALLKNANVIKRAEFIEFRVINTGETILRKQYALTILNEQGDKHAVFTEFYSKLSQITSVDGVLYDARGQVLKKVKGRDIQDLTATDDNNLVDDVRRKVHDFYYRSYPYTVEYEVVEKYNNTLFFPPWIPQEDVEYSVQQSQFRVICPQNYQVRHKAFNYSGEPVIRSEKDQTVMEWQVKHMPAVILPYAAPAWNELTTMVYLAPTTFEIQGYKGDMSSWREFGKFQTALNQGRDQLPPDVLQAVQQITARTTDKKEQVRLIYEYMQQHTRYISIQLGLGGWQPFEASYVAKRGYGDCKALTNYMYSLLKAAGIRSNYALVYAGSYKGLVLDDFPVNRFNHVILCVPMEKDSIWLECTSQSNPTGYMGSFTGNRKALVINENGGHVVATPRYGVNENTQIRKLKARLTEEGNLELDIHTRYGGLQQDDISSMINQLSKDDIKKVLNREMDLSSYDIVSFQYKEEKQAIPQVNEQLQLIVPNYATISSKRIFIYPNILNRGGARLTLDTARKVDYVYDMSYRDEDSAEIDLPAGYTIESPVKDVNLKSQFGTYSMTIKLDGNKLRFYRVREQFAGRFPPKDGRELVNFLEEIFKADRQRLVLVKQG